MSEREPGYSVRVTGLMAAGFAAAFALGRFVVPQATESSADNPPPLDAVDPEAAASESVQVAELSPPQGKRYLVPVSVSQPKRGPDTALVTVVEWCDLTGAKCRDADGLLKQLRHDYGDRVRHVWRHFPTENSENARDMHEVAHAAFESAGKFWELRDALLQRDSAPDRTELKELAGKLGMDRSVTEQGLARHGNAGYVAADSMFGAKFGVTEVPALFVNGRRLEGAPSYELLSKLVEGELAYAQKVVARGVDPQKVYEEVTRAGDWGSKTDRSSLAEAR